MRTFKKRASDQSQMWIPLSGSEPLAAAAGLNRVSHGRAGRSADCVAGDGADRTRDGPDARADGGAADPFFRGGAGCRRKNEERNESELFHENLRDQRMSDAFNEGPAASASPRAFS
jgi:hypothetical protein